MADESKSPKKGSIAEEDNASPIQRYSLWTVMTLLQEMNRVAGNKIDWDELVKNTETGISCAREYQMLWRRLSYGNTLEDQLDRDAEPMAIILFPLISLLYMTSMAVACVGDVHWFFYFLTLIDDFGLIHMLAVGCNLAIRIVEITNGYWPLLSNLLCYLFSFTNTFDSDLEYEQEASPAVSPEESAAAAACVKGTNVAIPVSVQKSTVRLTPSKKRREWSNKEDMRLTAAVHKYGEPDWANIAKGDFKNGRSASELSKRWTILMKKLHNPTVGSGSQLSETELAAASGALPMDNTLNAVNKINNESTEPQIQLFNAPASQPDKQSSITEPPISQVPKTNPPVKHTPAADSVKAAGARIGTSTDASSLIEAARSKKCSFKSPNRFCDEKIQSKHIRLPRHVHFFRGGQSKAPSSSYSAPVHSPAQADQPNPVGAAQVLSVSSEKTNSTANIPFVELTKNAEGTAGSTSGSGMRDLVQKDHIHHQSDSPISVPVEQVPHNQSSESGESGYQASISSGHPGNDTLDAHVAMMQISE